AIPLVVPTYAEPSARERESVLLFTPISIGKSTPRQGESEPSLLPSLFLCCLSQSPLRSNRHASVMYTATKSLQCLICGTPINHAHLGVDACRACAVFYKRHATFRKPLICRRGTNDCYEKNSKPFCRKCRFVKFAAILGQSLSEEEMTKLQSQPDSNDQHSDTSDPNSIESPDDENQIVFLDHRSFSLTPSSSNESYFDRMKRAYSMLCVIRKCGELGTNPNPMSLDDEVELVGDGIKFIPTTYSMKLPNSRIMFAGLIQFAEACFDDFKHITTESKHFIVNISFKMLSSLDGAYRSAHHFPDNQTMVSGYTSYWNEGMIESYVESCPFKINRKEVIEELKKGWSRSKDMNDFKRVNPSNEEFVAMMGLSLWNNDILAQSDEYMEMVERNRNEIMSELHKLYSRLGISDYAARLGELMCVLVSIEKMNSQIEEDLQLYKLMNLFKEDFGKLRC
ncbi:hypothetical protein PMAYCL1PPCAC_09830, partial [Pristionchus mayeri]